MTEAAADPLPEARTSTTVPRSLAWGWVASACAVPAAIVSFLPHAWHRPWSVAWMLACCAALGLSWRAARTSQQSVRQELSLRMPALLRWAAQGSRRRVVVGYSVAAVLAVLAAGTAWATMKEYCPPTVNECYSQWFTRPGAHLSPLLWNHDLHSRNSDLQPPAVARALLATIACGAAGLSWWRPRLVAYLALPVLLAAFMLATINGPQVSPRWSRTDVTSWLVPAVGMWLAMGCLITSGIATVAGLARPQQVPSVPAQDEPLPLAE